MGASHYVRTHVFANSDLAQVLNNTKGDGFTKTKVCITFGPALQDVDLVCDLLEAGASCARFDLSWQDIELHRQSLGLLQEAMRRTRRLCAVMLDCLGRDVLVRRPFTTDENGWPVHFMKTNITAGQKVVITTSPTAECTNEVFPINYSKFPSMVREGDSIFLGRYLATGADDSSLFLHVLEVGEEDVVCEAQNSAVLEGLLTVFHQERSAEGLSNLQNDMPVLSGWDQEAIATLCQEFEVDFVTLSYCRSPEDIQYARDFLRSIGKQGVKVVAKCETRQSLLNFRSISGAADAIMISRGNLGLDVAPEKMAMIQKATISACVRQGKPTIITRVVDTMAKSPRPTRAEATDVANAVLDGVDGIMLGAETFRGKYPLETVKTVAAICREAERVFDHHNHFEHILQSEGEEAFQVEEGLESDPDDPKGVRRANSSANGLHRVPSGGSLLSTITGVTGFGHNINPSRPAAGSAHSFNWKLESIASGAVRAADKVGAALIICITHTGKTASMIAKYRPPMPIMTLVVPYLKSQGLKWSLEGRSTARQALITSGLMPVMAAPTPSAGESLLEEAIALAGSNGMVGPHDHVVVVSLSSSKEAMIKVVSVNDAGTGIKQIRPTTLLKMISAAHAFRKAGADARARAGAVGEGAKAPAPAAMASADEAIKRLRRGSVIIGRADALIFDPENSH